MFNWASFLTYALITAATPGPNNLMSLSNAGRLGFRRALPFNFGILAGFSVVMLGCTAFCGLLSAYLPRIRPVMLVVGAAYMLALAWKTLRSAPGVADKTVRGGFLSGLALQFINPKIYLYGIVSIQAYILPAFGGRPAALAGFALLLAGIGFVCTVCWAAFGSAFRLLFSRYARATNAVMAALLVYCAVSLFL